jgi:hypothetical protein
MRTQGIVQERAIGHLAMCFFGLLDEFDAVADHGEVVAGLDAGDDSFLEGHFVQDGAHVQVIGHHEALVGELIAQELADDVF